MEDSILNSIKKMIGPTSQDTYFDTDIITHINSVFSILKQLGVGPEEDFSIADSTATWGDYLGENYADLNAVITYVYMRVKLLFDPPLNSSVIASMEKIISEIEWRLNVAAESNKE